MSWGVLAVGEGGWMGMLAGDRWEARHAHPVMGLAFLPRTENGGGWGYQADPGKSCFPWEICESQGAIKHSLVWQWAVTRAGEYAVSTSAWGPELSVPWDLEVLRTRDSSLCYNTGFHTGVCWVVAALRRRRGRSYWAEGGSGPRWGPRGPFLWCGCESGHSPGAPHVLGWHVAAGLSTPGAGGCGAASLPVSLSHMSTSAPTTCSQDVNQSRWSRVVWLCVRTRVSKCWAHRRTVLMVSERAWQFVLVTTITACARRGPASPCVQPAPGGKWLGRLGPAGWNFTAF